MEITTTCQKCPKIKGDTYCNFHKKTIWKADEMCEQGYRERIYKGLDMCSKIYNAEPEDKDVRIDKILKQVEEIEKLLLEKFPPNVAIIYDANEDSNGGIKVLKEVEDEELDEPDVPF